MDLFKKTFLIVSYYTFIVTSIPINRIKRAGGRVEITQLIRPPTKLKAHETHYPPPGWTHCIKKVAATTNWRAIGGKQEFKFQTAQFQCTWMISVVQSGIPSKRKRVQISVQKLELGNQNDKNCRQNFLEIIDSGKSQGRFCDKHRPGDYVSLGNHVRIDVQGEDTLANLVRAKGRNPFVISYRAVTEPQPGFRTYVTKAKNIIYDRYHPPSHGFGGGLSNVVKPTKGNTQDKGKDDDVGEEDQFGSLGLVGVITLAVCGTVVVLIILLILARRCCRSDKEKSNKDKPDSSSSEETNYYDPPNPYSKPIGLPCQTYAPLGHHPSLATKNEVIISSEIIRPANPRKSSSYTTKEKSATLNINQSEVAQSKTVDKVVKTKTGARRRKPDVKGNRETKKIKVVSKPLIRQRHHNSKRAQAKKHSSQSKERKRKNAQDVTKEKRKRKSGHYTSKEERKERSKSPEKNIRHKLKNKQREETYKRKTNADKSEADWPLRRHPNPKKSNKKSDKKENKKPPKDCDVDQQVKQRKAKKRAIRNKESQTKSKEKSSSPKKKSKNTKVQRVDADHNSNSADPTPQTRYKSKSKSRKTTSKSNKKT